ncbi:MAG: shikimate dehydrogenase [Planctomycetaceae bacterium]|nr:shikimate dehydrogenase [Planctomycetaceae bacterium]
MSLLCVTLAVEDPEQLLAEHARFAANGCKLVEYRLDFLPPTTDVSALVRRRPGPIIATVRLPRDGGRWKESEALRLDWLRKLQRENVEYIDFEPEAAQAVEREGLAKRIVSLHDFQATPTNLAAEHARLAACGADVVKLAVMAQSAVDGFRVLKLVAAANVPTVAFCMGELGMASRVLLAKAGARFADHWTYAAPSDEAAVAPGQIGYERLRDLYRYEQITADTPIYGVIGDPIGHSKSPLIHNAALRALDLPGCYVPFRVSPADLEEFLREAREFGIRGLSVTIPHKEAILDFAARHDEAVDVIGAANTLVMPPEGDVRAYNTDEPGALDSLVAALALDVRRGDALAGKTALVLGAGGAAKGIAFGLRRRGARTLVTNHNRGRADELAASLGCEVVDWAERDRVAYDMLVNCTPLGMFPKVDETPLAADALHPDAVVFDTVYNPEETKLVREARARGCQTVVGTEMFLRQATWQFRYFTGYEAPLEVMRAALRAGRVLDDEPIALIGYRGTGKSTVARLIAERIGRQQVDADVELERRAGKTIAEIFADDGETAFRELESSVIADLAQRKRIVIAAGGGVILREANRAVLKPLGRVAWLQASAETLLRRIESDQVTAARRPNLTPQGGIAEVVELLARREPYYRECATLVVDAENRTAVEVADAIVAAWFPETRKVRS